MKWPSRLKLVEPLIAPRNWAQAQPDYVWNMTIRNFRLWMNKKLGTNVSGLSSVDSASQTWLKAIAKLDKPH